MSTHQKFKIAAGLWIFAAPCDRFCPNGYRESIPPKEQLKLAAKVKGLSGVELHTSDFKDKKEAKELHKIISDLGLKIACINVNIFSDRIYQYGAFTSSDEKVRKKAIDTAKFASSISQELGVNYINIWPGQDGYDYPFQVDYRDMWQRTIDAIREVAEYNKDVRVSIEYKLKEPRTHMQIATVCKALAIVQEINLANLGVVIDFGHALMAYENPADSVVLLSRYNKLFGVHFNDCYRSWDDDMIVSSVHFWETLEFLYYCIICDYKGWLSLDMFPYREDPVQAVNLSIRNINNMLGLLNKIDFNNLKKAKDTLDALQTQQLIRKVIFT